jgi:hypothetical protein
MNVDLHSLKDEIIEHLGNEGFVVFHGYSRLANTDSFVTWDTDRHPDFRLFLGAAKKAGVGMIVFHERKFSSEHVEDVRDRLEACDLTAEERRNLERRLSELRAYEGFTCALELSFDYQGRVYLYNVRAEWYEDYLDLLDEVDMTSPDEEAEEDESMGGYYSRN